MRRAGTAPARLAIHRVRFVEQERDAAAARCDPSSCRPTRRRSSSTERRRSSPPDPTDTVTPPPRSTVTCPSTVFPTPRTGRDTKVCRASPEIPRAAAQSGGADRHDLRGTEVESRRQAYTRSSPKMWRPYRSSPRFTGSCDPPKLSHGRWIQAKRGRAVCRAFRDSGSESPMDRRSGCTPSPSSFCPASSPCRSPSRGTDGRCTRSARFQALGTDSNWDLPIGSSR